MSELVERARHLSEWHRRNTDSNGTAAVLELLADRIEALEKVLCAVDIHWTSLFPYGPEEPDAHKHINSAALASWRMVRAALGGKA